MRVMPTDRSLNRPALTAAQIAGLLEEGDNAALVRLAEVDDKSTQQLTHDFCSYKRAIVARRWYGSCKNS